MKPTNIAIITELPIKKAVFIEVKYLTLKSSFWKLKATMCRIFLKAIRKIAKMNSSLKQVIKT